jgi:prepilin-type N-terminal cleavage/methylation domain-containing protein
LKQPVQRREKIGSEGPGAARAACDDQGEARGIEREECDVMCAAAPASAPRRTQRGRRDGFTLIEILIVVIILGILASIIVPQFSSASTQARETTLKEDLRYLRTQIGAFKIQHRDVPPGYAGGDLTVDPDETTFLDQMTRYSDEFCNTSTTTSSVYRVGPYLTKMPPNPLNGKSGVRVVTGATMPAADETQPFGWIYNPTLQRIQVNLAGSDSSGTPFASY